MMGAGAQLAEFILLLKFSDLIRHASLGEVQDVCKTLEFREPPQHTSAVDDQLAYCVHHAIEALERDAHGLRLRYRRNLALGDREVVRFYFFRFGRGVLDDRCMNHRQRDLYRLRLADNRRGNWYGGGFSRTFRLRRNLFQFFWSKPRDPGEQLFDTGLRAGFIRPLPIQEFLERVHALQANVYDLRTGMQQAVAQTPDEVFCTMRHASDAA